MQAKVMGLKKQIQVFICILLIVASVSTWPLSIDDMLQEAEDDDNTAWDNYRLPDYPDIVFVKYQGDILMPKDEYEEVYGERSTKARRKRYAEDILWGDQVPYKIGDEFNEKQKKTLERVFDYWRLYTCLNFIHYVAGGSHTHYIDIKKHEKGCFSEIGKQSDTNETIVRLADACFQNESSILIHELGHAIGLQHEHQRSDRDTYLAVYEDNIEVNKSQNFLKLQGYGYENYRLKMSYDFLSVMHYGKHYFAKIENESKLVTMEPKEGYEQFRDIMGNVSGASYLDVKYLNTIYKCDDGCGDIKCPEKAFLGKSCKCYCKQVEDRGNAKIPIARCSELCKEMPNSVNTSVYDVDRPKYSTRSTKFSACVYWHSNLTCGMHCNDITCDDFGWKVTSLPLCIKERCEFQEGWNQMFIEEEIVENNEDPSLTDRPHGYEMDLICRNNESKISVMQCDQGKWKGHVPNCNENAACNVSEHLCDNGMCVEHSNQDLSCDRKMDCPDESDEYGCVEPNIITLSENEVRVAINGEVSIECTAAGEPIPEIHWLDRRKASMRRVAERGHVHAKKTAPRSRTLTITDADMGDEGTYICRAQNNFGTDEKMLNITVYRETCAADLFLCNDGTCRGELGLDIKCDNYPDCDDGSDEIGCAAPYITSLLEKDMRQAKLGSTFSVSCEASGYPLPDITWLDIRAINMKHIPPTGRVRVDESVEGMSELIITDVTADDEGTYVCRAHSNNGEDIHYIDITVVEGKPTCKSNEIQCKSGECLSLGNKRCDGTLDCSSGEDEENCPAPSILNLMEEETRYVQFRSKVAIPCSAMGYPTPNVTWRRGSSGDDIPKTGSIIASDGSKGASTLTIARVLTMDQGVYSCRAVNSGGEDIHYVTVSLSKEICADGLFLCNDGTCSGEHGLDIRCDGYSDCDDGSDEIGCAAPKITSLQEVDTREAKLGSTFSVRCEASGYPPPDITWLDTIDMNHIPPTGRVKVDKSIEGVSELIITDVTAEDEGTYACRARNSNYEEDIRHLYITVVKDMCPSDETRCKSGKCLPLDKRCDGTIDCESGNDEENCPAPPEIVNLSKKNTRKVIQTSTLTITCKASGYPTPTVQWIRRFSAVGRTGRVRASDGSRGEATLTIAKARMKDGGWYRCRAVNSVGKDVQKFKVTVAKAQPTIVNLPDTRKVKRGSTLSVTCKANGRPRPTVTWLDGNDIAYDEFPLTGRVRASEGSKGSSTLKITDARKEDQGSYICRAVNNKGEDIHYLNITVT